MTKPSSRNPRNPTKATPPPLASPLATDGRTIPITPWSEFLTTFAVGVPLWLATVVPLSLAATVLSQLVPTNQKKKEKERQQLLSSFDSGYVADSVTPPSDRPYDIVVLGATGFAGFLAARHLVQTYGINTSSQDGVRWAIAGRSRSKLEQVRARLGATTNDEIPIIVVDTTVPSQLPRLVDATRVVVSTVGPFAEYGSTVVEFCVKFGTHYADITGEVDWVQAMMEQWQSTAEQTHAVLVPFCGHDSIPWDLSTMCLLDVFEQKFVDDTLQSVTFLDSAVGGASGGTLATVLRNIRHGPMPRKQENIDPMECSRNEQQNQLQPLMAFPLRKLHTVWYDTPIWTSPFVMAVVNSKVAAWSYAHRGAKGSGGVVQYDEVLYMPDFKTAATTFAGLVMFGTALLNPLTRFLLYKYVLPKPGEGPSMEDMENKSTYMHMYRLQLGTRCYHQYHAFLLALCDLSVVVRLLVHSGGRGRQKRK